MNDSNNYQMAMFRFGLIAPVINGTYVGPSRLAYYRSCVENGLTHPDGTKASYAAGTLRYWEWLYRKDGFDALIDKRRTDKGKPRKLSPKAIDAILALKREFPKINATMLYEHLIKAGTIRRCDVSLSTIQRFIRRNEDLGCLPKESKDRRAFEAARVLEMWQADTLHGPYIADGTKRRRAYLMAIIDDKSRLIVGARFFFADIALNFQKVMKDAVIRFGIPEKVYLDNGGPYSNGQLTGICGALGVVLIHTPPYDGAAKGKIERWNRTCRQRFLSVLPEHATTSLDALNDALAKWIITYNTTVHSSINMTPMDAYRKEAENVRTAESAEWVSACFMNRIVRTVKNDATVTINKVTYDVPMQFIGTKVEVHFPPDDMDEAHIVAEESRYPIQRTDKQANARIRRVTSPYKVDYGKGDTDHVPPTIPA
jgi:transposase InsO family protein